MNQIIEGTYIRVPDQDVAQEANHRNTAAVREEDGEREVLLDQRLCIVYFLEDQTI